MTRTLPKTDVPWTLVFDLIAAARRVRAKFGTDMNGSPLAWPDWKDLDEACNAIDRQAADVGAEGVVER